MRVGDRASGNSSGAILVSERLRTRLRQWPIRGRSVWDNVRFEVGRLRPRAYSATLRSPVPPRTARRAETLAQSEIRRMTRECERIGGINLGQGICDLPTHPLVREGAIAAIRENRSTYSFPEGTATLR